jgi:hypothetical protein
VQLRCRGRRCRGRLHTGFFIIARSSRPDERDPWDDRPRAGSAEPNEYNEPRSISDAVRGRRKAWTNSFSVILGTQSATSKTSPRAHGGAMNGIVVAL